MIPLVLAFHPGAGPNPIRMRGIIFTCAMLFCMPVHAEEGVSFLGEAVVVLEYESVYSVHPQPDPINYPNMRVQPGEFDVRRILADLQNYLHTESYDFVLIYSLIEIPGWIHAGKRFSQPLGENIGWVNRGSGDSWAPAGWDRLRSVPHMNDIGFIQRTTPENPNYGGSLTAFHECFHYWGPNMTHNYSVGPHEWTPDMPVAWLGQSSRHWSWNFVDTEEFNYPGIMGSGPTSDQFNAFDLYIMGLLGYDTASEYIYTVYEHGDETKHDLTLDDLIYSMSLLSSSYYSGDGKRIPDIDPTASHINCLVVIIKGQDEKLTDEDVGLVLDMVDDMPEAWAIATWGLSSMEVKVDRRQESLERPVDLNLEVTEVGINLARYVESGKQVNLYSSNDLNVWTHEESIWGDGQVIQRFFKKDSGKKFFQLAEVPTIAPQN